VLGPVTVRRDDDPVASSRVTQPRQIALICYLALARPRGLHSRDTLIALLWPDHSEVQGRRALRNALHGVRQRLGAHTIISTGDHLIGLDPAHISCDAWDLEGGRTAIVLNDAAVLPDPMQGLHVADAGGFDHWMSIEQGRLRALLNRRGRSAISTEPIRPPSLQNRYSPDAWVMHARGHYLFLRTAHGGPAEDLLRSRDYFERSLALDPTFAPALAGLSNFYAVAARRGVLTPFHETFAKTITLSEQALAMDPTLAVPHVHFGVKALYIDDDWDRAGDEFATAVTKDPSYAEGHRFYGVWLGLVQRHREAVQAMQQGITLEPDIPHMLSSLAAAQLGAGDITSAEEVLRRTLLLDPRHAPARERLIRLLDEAGRFEEAVAERQRAPATHDAHVFQSALVRGAASYRQAVHDALTSEAMTLEARLVEQTTETVNDIFAPPVVKLVSLFARLGDWKRVQRWKLQAKARRPGLGKWFESLPELRQAPV
jgi:DNA-binding SARP family transcriptional activator